MSIADAQVLAPAITLITIILGAVFGLMVRRADRKDAVLKDERDRKDADLKEQREATRRAEERAEKLAQDNQNRAEVLQRAQELADKVVLQLENKRLLDEAAHRETITKLDETHTAAISALIEANATNIKIADTTKHIEEVQSHFEARLTELPSVIKTAMTPLSTAEVVPVVVVSPDSPPAKTIIDKLLGKGGA